MLWRRKRCRLCGLDPEHATQLAFSRLLKRYHAARIVGAEHQVAKLLAYDRSLSPESITTRTVHVYERLLREKTRSVRC